MREKYRKRQTFQIYGFLKYFGETEIHTISKTWEKWIPIIQEKYGKKTLESFGFLNVLGDGEIHTILRIWEKWIPVVREKFGKTQSLQI